MPKVIQGNGATQSSRYVPAKKPLSSKQIQDLFAILKLRFEENMKRHIGLEWSKVQTKLESNPEKLWSLNEMEATGGEPDIVNFDQSNNQYLFIDCSKETPQARRNCCFDQAALDSRKNFKPANSAMGMATDMGIELLDQEQYRKLQELGEFDLKTSSWIKTPTEIRKLGGALFADRRYNTVFVYHNGAESYYGVRGFRGVLKV